MGYPSFDSRNGKAENSKQVTLWKGPSLYLNVKSSYLSIILESSFRYLSGNLDIFFAATRDGTASMIQIKNVLVGRWWDHILVHFWSSVEVLLLFIQVPVSTDSAVFISLYNLWWKYALVIVHMCRHRWDQPSVFNDD